MPTHMSSENLFNTVVRFMKKGTTPLLKAQIEDEDFAQSLSACVLIDLIRTDKICDFCQLALADFIQNKIGELINAGAMPHGRAILDYANSQKTDYIRIARQHGEENIIKTLTGMDKLCGA